MITVVVGQRGAAGAGGAAGSPPPVCNLTCAAHQTCVLQGATPTCACVTGYQASGATCVWTPIPKDPGFQNVPAGSWTLEQGATLNPTAGGNIESGELDITKSSLCTSRGRARQSVTIPPLAQAEPLAIKIASNGDCISSGGPGGCSGPGTAVVLNGGATVFPYQSLSTIQTACLGERAYGGTYDLVVRPANRQICPSAASVDIVVDHLDIEPAPTCPAPGSLPDGNFDATPNTWKTSVGTANTPAPVAEIQAGAGTGATAAAHLQTSNPCQEARVEELISPPLASVPNLAVQLSYKGPVGASVTVEMGGVRVAALPGTGATVTGKFCLLEGNKGMTQDLLFGMLLPFGGGGVGCGGINTKDFVLDDLKFVTDTTCPAKAFVADGGFERTDPASAWDSLISNNGVATGVAAVGIDTTAANVHSGARALKMVNNVGCGYAQATLAATIPASAAGAGPALQFFYKAPVLTGSTFTVTAPGATTASLPAAAAYTMGQLCLDPTMAGQTVGVLLNLNGIGTAGCSATYAAETVWLDDFTVTTSASCPAD